MGSPLTATGEARPQSTVQSAAGGPLAMTWPLLAVWVAVAVSLPLLAILLVASAPRLAAATFATPSVLALTHAATLGWGTLTVFGASYQMSQSLLGRRLVGERWVPWQLGVFVAGALSIVAGFLSSHLTLVATGGSLVTLSSWAFMVIMMRSTRALRHRSHDTPTAPQDRSRGRWVHGLAMAVATTCLGLLTAWGVVLALSLRYPFWPELHQQWAGLVVHAALGLGGWFGLMVVGVSFRLVPLVHGTGPVPERRALTVTALLVVAVTLAVAGALSGVVALRRAAAALVPVVHVLYSRELVILLRQRRRESPDLNVHHWFAVMAWGTVISTLALAWALGGFRHGALATRLAVGAAVAFLGGWVTQAILGQLYKVSPFLMWHYRAFIADVLAIPTLPHLYAPRTGRLSLWATNLGMAGVVMAVLAGHPEVGQAGAAAFAVGALAASWLFGYSWLWAVAKGRLPFVWRR